MNDDVKAARESIKEFRDWAQRLNQLARHSKDGMSNSLIAADNQRAIEVKTKILLAHIDGEPARIAAACEETREACAQRVPSIGQPHDCFVPGAPHLTATPLGDALARAEEGVRYWTDLAQAEARDAATLRARVAALEAAHTEALDALEKLCAAQKHVLEVRCAGDDEYMAAVDGAEAVLAKAGRR